MTMAILIKLLTIRMVANNFAGLSRNLIMKEDDLFLSFFKSSILDDDSEKKAISLPEIKAEHNNKRRRMIIETINPVIPMFK